MSNPKQLIFPFSLDKKSSIKKFFVPNGCANLIAAIKDDNAGDIFLSGKKGVGKSYLLQATCNDLSSSSFVAAYIPLSEAVKLKPELLDGLESLDLVCIDDLNTICANREWEVACFNLINRCNDTGCRLIFSCSETPSIVVRAWLARRTSVRRKATLRAALRTSFCVSGKFCNRSKRRVRGMQNAST